jgi:hypothetical protein
MGVPDQPDLQKLSGPFANLPEKATLNQSLNWGMV